MHSYPSEHVHQAEPRSVFEACRQLFIDLRLKLRQEPRDVDALVWVYREIQAYPLMLQISAFDSVVDDQGW